MLEDALFEDHTSGAIEVNAGSLTLHRSILRRNEAARGGALLVTGGDVRVDNTLFELNTATGGPESGGAIYVQDASTMVLGNETKIATALMRAINSGSSVDLMMAQASFEDLDVATRRQIHGHAMRLADTVH